MLERQEEEAWSPILCPPVGTTPCHVAERRICEIPGPAQSLTSKSSYYHQSPVNEGWWEGHHLLQGLEAHLLFLFLIVEESFEQLSTPRDLRDGGRLPTSRDSSVAVLILSHIMMFNLLRLGGSWTSAIYLNESQNKIVKISRDEFASHIHASGNDFSASQCQISIFLNLEGRAISGKETRELQLLICISLKELRLSDDCGSFTRPSQSLNPRYSSLLDNSQSCCCWSFSSSATKD
ncbi:hypothetical protein CUMW_283090 [Citrus unshiu]|uniref:Uncharacterized protein n=1 Tax=Citrus unshiu TaxID=55188 RepID=A0A2H5N4Y5_CITUN|nr:hypothetical protein CUMW_283090 [Citrus unshiu]